MKESIKIALICFDNPFVPPSEGGKRGILTRIESLSLIEDIEIDVYLLTKASESFSENFNGLENKNCKFFQYKMNDTLSSAFGTFPICVNKRFVKECADEIQKHKYDFAIYEGEQVSKYRFRNVVNAKYHILYFHDIESNYRMEMSTSQKGIRKIANRIESAKFARIEKKIDRAFDRLWFVSCDECSDFSTRVRRKEKCLYIPFPALNIVNEPVKNVESHEMVYIGDLTIQHNFLSLLWFVENVWSKIKLEKITPTLKVIGRISKPNEEKLKKMGVQVCGYVDNIDAVYRQANCIIAPVLYGAGVKVKTVDALARGQIVVTTKKGIEGTQLKNGVHLIAEDDPGILIEHCKRLLLKRRDYEPLAERGLLFVMKSHTVFNQATVIKNEIMGLMLILNRSTL